MIDFKQDEAMSFYQMQQKYGLTIQEVMEQYIAYRAKLRTPNVNFEYLASLS